MAVPNLIAAMLCGGVIGAERQWRHRTAGLKTNALVAVGAASFLIMAPATGTPDAAARIAAQIVSGIGFLGAGVILREGLNVRGLNTAATLWCSAASGCLCGAGEVLLATLTTAAILTVNLGSQPLVNWINRRPGYAFRIESVYALPPVGRARGADGPAGTQRQGRRQDRQRGDQPRAAQRRDRVFAAAAHADARRRAGRTPAGAAGHAGRRAVDPLGHRSDGGVTG
jgi:hypothetical protein